MSELELKINLNKQPKARVNAIGFSFAFDWLGRWGKFSRPITERSKTKPIQSWIILDAQLKIALFASLKITYRIKIILARLGITCKILALLDDESFVICNYLKHTVQSVLNTEH